jgi:hypothetical protein
MTDQSLIDEALSLADASDIREVERTVALYRLAHDHEMIDEIERELRAYIDRKRLPPTTAD